MRCTHCGFEDEGKFCSNCGMPLEDTSEGVPINAELQIKLGFGKSSSANYSFAVDLIQQQPSYSHDGTVHTAIFDKDSLEQFFEIFDLVKVWRTSFVEINNQKFPIAKIRLGLSCYRERQKAYDPEKYCFGIDAGEDNLYSTNPLGCRHCGITNNYWSGGWFTIGKLSHTGIFTVDKDQIRHIVKKNIEEVGLCPVLDDRDILNRIDELPDTINPRVDKHFEYATNWVDDKMVAVGVRLKDTRGAFVVKDDSDLSVELSRKQVAVTNHRPSSGGCGCISVIATLSLISVLILVLALF